MGRGGAGPSGGGGGRVGGSGGGGGGHVGSGYVRGGSSRSVSGGSTGRGGSSSGGGFSGSGYRSSGNYVRPSGGSYTRPSGSSSPRPSGSGSSRPSGSRPGGSSVRPVEFTQYERSESSRPAPGPSVRPGPTVRQTTYRTYDRTPAAAPAPAPQPKNAAPVQTAQASAGKGSVGILSALMILPVLILLLLLARCHAPGAGSSGSGYDYSYTSDSKKQSNKIASDITKSTVNRKKLAAGSVKETGYYEDDLDWIASKSALLKGMQKFYKLTGVQPYLLISGEVNGTPLTKEDLSTKAGTTALLASLKEWMPKLYGQLFEDEAHLLVYVGFYEDDSYSNYVTYCWAGEKAQLVMDDEAIDILLDYIDVYYDDFDTYPDGREDKMFSDAFADAAARIMKTAAKAWRIVLIVFMILAIMVIAFFIWRAVKKQKNLEAEQTLQILNTPLQTYADAHLNDLAEKYEKEGAAAVQTAQTAAESTVQTAPAAAETASQTVSDAAVTAAETAEKPFTYADQRLAELEAKYDQDRNDQKE